MFVIREKERERVCVWMCDESVCHPVRARCVIHRLYKNDGRLILIHMHTHGLIPGPPASTIGTLCAMLPTG